MSSKESFFGPDDPAFATDTSNQSWGEVIVEGNADKIKSRLEGELADLVKKWSRRLQGYTLLFFYTDESIGAEDADKIYQALQGIKPSQRKNVLLVLVSNGGYVVPAYQISKLCREWSKDEFIVAAPRHAKSAATLICLGADAVHMGPLSHLGPIDPQIKGVSGLAHKASLQAITKWVSDHPGSHELWSEILSKDESFDYFDVGDFDRSVESAVQYGERLLVAGKSDPERAAVISRKLVYEYKDHGFVIDREEAIGIFGEASIIINSNELSFSEEVYNLVSYVDKGLRALEFDGVNVVQGGIKVVGSLRDCVIVLPPSVPRQRRLYFPEEIGADAQGRP
jgi:hypothetical protein